MVAKVDSIMSRSPSPWCTRSSKGPNGSAGEPGTPTGDQYVTTTQGRAARWAGPAPCRERRTSDMPESAVVDLGRAVELQDGLHGPTLGILHARNSAEARAQTLNQRQVRVYTELSRGACMVWQCNDDEGLPLARATRPERCYLRVRDDLALIIPVGAQSTRDCLEVQDRRRGHSPRWPRHLRGLVQQ